MNIFLRIYTEMWLVEESLGQEQLIESLTQSFEEAEEHKAIAEEEVEQKPDPLTQLVTTFSRKATTEHGGPIKSDELYMDFAYIFSQSCGGAEEEEEGEGEEGEGEEGGQSIHVSLITCLFNYPFYYPLQDILISPFASSSKLKS